MSLVTNDKSSLYGGVNQQSAEHRSDNQVEEMVNAIPTIDRGLLKRNPTTRKELSEDIDYTNDIWNYEYDRGTAGNNEEQYSVNITQAKGVEIVNINSGKVYTESNNGLTIGQDAKDYIYPFVSGNGYAATTIKDTTFLVNKSVLPRLNASLYDPEDSTSTRILNSAKIPYFVPHTSAITGGGNTGGDYNLYKAGPAAATLIWKKVVNPGSSTYFYGLETRGGTTYITVDGITVVYTSKSSGWIRGYSSSEADARSTWNYHAPEDMNSYVANLVSRLTATLGATGLYNISATSSHIVIERNDGSLVSVTISVTIPEIPCWYTSGCDSSTHRWLKPSASNFFGTVVNDTRNEIISIPNNSYLATGFVWVQRASSVDGYNYIATIKYNGVDAIRLSPVTGASTEIVATNLATAITAEANLTAVAIGSIVKITTDDESEIEYVTTSDSFGNQASKGFGYTVATMNDLPSNMEYEGTIIKVSGTENGVFQTYWVKYDGSVWQETKDPEALSTIDKNTMPHRLTRNGDDTFTLEAFDAWDTRKVGDDETNAYPSFLSNGKVSPSPIKDIFFFKNRLGFITSTTVAISEVGKYGNFWRTTVFAVLDSDPIDTAVDSSKAIELEYASYLEDSLMLFADKAQFKLSGNRILSPNSVQISQTSAFETDRNVRPIFLNDKIFFIVKRGENSAMYEYFIAEGTSEKSDAVDVTAHVQTYLPNDIVKLSGSPVNNMLFAFAKSTPDTIYVYKYYDVSGTRSQSAWFKWTFNGEIFNAFSFGKYLNLLIARKSPIASEDWVVGSGIWESDKLWDSSKLWISDPIDLDISNQFEQLNITPIEYTGNFADDDREVEDTDNTISLSINANTASGNVLTRKDMRVLLYTTDAIVTINHEVILGGGSMVVYYGTDTVTVPIVIGTTETTVTIPYAISTDIFKVDIIPAYNTVCEMTINSISIKYVNSNEELLYNDNNLGWYVDGVAIPKDPLSVQGDWIKSFGTKSTGATITSLISIGEWVLSSGNTKSTRGHLQFKTIEVNSEEGSDFDLVVEDIGRNTIRSIKSKFTVGRRPMIYGNSKDIRVHVRNASKQGFRINAISFEGNFNSRSKKV